MILKKKAENPFKNYDFSVLTLHKILVFFLFFLLVNG